MVVNIVLPSKKVTNPLLLGGPALHDVTAAVKEMPPAALVYHLDGVRAIMTGAGATVNVSVTGPAAA
jgi:hypothetical protein